MHEKEIQYFTEAFQLAQDKFYVDAMHEFNKLVDSTSNHFYNIFKSYLPIMNIGKKTIE